jgi:hypothetical protein
MKKIILKHLTVSGYMKGIDLTDCDLLSQRLEDAKEKMKDAKQDVKAAKLELNLALEDSIKKIKKENGAEKKIQNNSVKTSAFTSVFKNKEFKAKYIKKLSELKQKRNDVKKKLEAYKSDGSNKWDLFKSELNHDLDGIEKSVRNFMDYNKKKVKKLAS